ncbi:MAG: CoA transferase [Variovorax sp.]|jgi:crotonobetainyl-CoA:carnitine CoA-transferase CaiB-like acyl-CoA transferase|nr:CoA transferase [Variovorax sp.]
MTKMNTQPGARPGAKGALDGVRIVDLTSVVLGPLATQILGDYGADVVKVEGMEGDHSRARGVTVHPGMASIYLAINRNKRSIAVDLKTPEGRAVLERLVAGADVVVHNMRVRAIEKLGFGYEQVKALNPRVVYCAATGFDQDGPDRDKPAFDDIIQAACGLVALNEIGLGRPGYAPTLVADKTAGMAVVNAVLAALFHRERSGEGQYVEVPMFETLVSFMLTEHLAGKTFVDSDRAGGYQRLLTGGRKPAPTLDGEIAILPYTARHWTAFFTAAGRADLVVEYAVHDRQARSDNIPAMYRSMAEITAGRTTAEWMRVCAELDIPATIIYTIDGLLKHPQLEAVGLFETAEHPCEGTVRYVRPPTKFAATPASVRSQAPVLGQHSSELLSELGYDAAAIDDLRRRGIVIQGDPLVSDSLSLSDVTAAAGRAG